MNQPLPSHIEVVSHETGAVVHRVNVAGKSGSSQERVMDGMDRNLDHEKFYTRFYWDSEGS